MRKLYARLDDPDAVGTALQPAIDRAHDPMSVGLFLEAYVPTQWIPTEVSRSLPTPCSRQREPRLDARWALHVNELVLATQYPGALRPGARGRVDVRAHAADELGVTGFTMARDHICVCVCTYKRPAGLERLLEKLRLQDTKGLFDFSVVVVDNDRSHCRRARRRRVPSRCEPRGALRHGARGQRLTRPQPNLGAGRRPLRGIHRR